MKDAAAFWRSCSDWIDGISITIPHKSTLIELMDENDQLAAGIGAINTVCRGEHGQSVGLNTDAHAALDCVREAIGGVNGRRVLLGAGGVARAIAYAFHAAGAGSDHREPYPQPGSRISPRDRLRCGWFGRYRKPRISRAD